MSASTKLSTSVKALCFLARNPGQPKCSAEIAREININASKLRKLLAMLVRHGIVTSTQGSTGGFLLNRDASDIHLQEIYCAIEDRKAFHLNVPVSSTDDPSNLSLLNRYFLDLFAEIQVDIEDKMRQISLQSIMKQALNPQEILTKERKV